ncbi:uncharacterized protein LOC130448295 [Diorhabda sublineata]|uniref:uncharacterized protein LOC130448295 n=1 Tax=Diorhabda sublineata TaxID=1163346 RepID=UPI0024E0E5E8|nr:uncharacterized protein LOC130448295 [Diorhabda sublineata]
MIEKVKELPGYKIGNRNITILCSADDAVLISNSEDNLQRMLHIFNKTAKEYNMEITTEKTDCLTVSKEPLRCKLEIGGTIIKQVISSRYLGVDVTSHRDIYQETIYQVRDIVWRNKHIGIETKTRIYKTCIRPILTYALETRADTKKTKQTLRTTEMKTLRCIIGKTRRDYVRNEDIRQQCIIQEIVRWGRERRRNWNQHVARTEEHRLAKIIRDGKYQEEDYKKMAR